MTKETPQPKVRIAFLLQTGKLTTFDQQGNQIPGLSGEYSKDLHKKIIDAADEHTVWHGFDWNTSRVIGKLNRD